MPKLSGHATHAIKEFPAKNNSSANAGAQCEHCHVLHIARGPQPFLSKGGNVGVVVQANAGTKPALDLVADGVITPTGQVGGFPHHAFFDIDDAWNTNAGADETSGGSILRGKAMNGLAHLAYNIIAPQGNLHPQSDFFQQLAFRGNRGDAEIRTAHIHTNGVVRHNE